ncbi:MAG: hypothetical protein WBL60_06640 [Saccharofermentanales bacterium]
MADRDFLEEILETEAEAASRIEKAREVAQLERQRVRQETSARIDNAYSEAASIRQKTLDEAESRYTELISDQSSVTVRPLESLSEDELSRAADDIAERIVSLLEHR